MLKGGGHHSCRFGVIFATSDCIEDLKPRLLGDDRDFFAVYNPSPNTRKALLDEYPQLEEVFTPISAKLDTKTLREHNYTVGVEGESPETVAQRYLRE